MCNERKTVFCKDLHVVLCSELSLSSLAHQLLGHSPSLVQEGCSYRLFQLLCAAKRHTRAEKAVRIIAAERCQN